jgi:hypothetical protein
MHIENMPFCCTTAVLGMFGEHGEQSTVTVDEIKKLIATKTKPRYAVGRDGQRELVENGKRCILATSVDPHNIATLKAAGFMEIASYLGVQGRVHILVLHD